MKQDEKQTMIRIDELKRKEDEMKKRIENEIAKEEALKESECYFSKQIETIKKSLKRKTNNEEDEEQEETTRNQMKNELHEGII